MKAGFFQSVIKLLRFVLLGFPFHLKAAASCRRRNVIFTESSLSAYSLSVWFLE